MRPGRILREMWRDDAQDSLQRVADRIAYRAAAEQAHRECVAQFAPFTAENICAALSWQDQRIRALLREGA